LFSNSLFLFDSQSCLLSFLLLAFEFGLFLLNSNALTLSCLFFLSNPFLFLKFLFTHHIGLSLSFCCFFQILLMFILSLFLF
jgi:hypothetical protein